MELSVIFKIEKLKVEIKEEGVHLSYITNNFDADIPYSTMKKLFRFILEKLKRNE